MDKELRYLNNAELRLDFGTYGPKITGYAAVFNSLSEDLGGFKEVIRPGAFVNSLKTADVRALINHNSNLILGRNTSGTLQLQEDVKGLHFQVAPPNTSYARDLTESLKRGDISGCSFGFFTVKDAFREEPQGTIRELLQVDVFDVSVVTYPAYPATSVSARSFRSWQQEQEDKRKYNRQAYEHWLRIAEKG